MSIDVFSNPEEGDLYDRWVVVASVDRTGETFAFYNHEAESLEVVYTNNKFFVARGWMPLPKAVVV